MKEVGHVQTCKTHTSFRAQTEGAYRQRTSGCTRWGCQVERKRCGCVRVCQSVCELLWQRSRESEWACVKEGLFLASHFFSLLLQRNAIGVRETRAGSKQSSACHTHTYTQHLAAPSNTRHGNGTAAIRGEEPFLSIEGETESKMKGRKWAREEEKGGQRCVSENSPSLKIQYFYAALTRITDTWHSLFFFKMCGVL